MDNNLLKTYLNHWRLTVYVAIVFSLILVFHEAVAEIWARWGEERYSHAPVVLALAIYLAWAKRDQLQETNRNAWYGVGIVFLSVLILEIGQLSAIWTIVQYSVVFLLFGLAWSMLGSTQVRKLAVPFLQILIVIPLPYLLDVMLSGKFQLMSSNLGVDLIRILGLPVYQDGNVIDLGIYKLQVVEACSGLNYTYPLMALGLVMSYLYRAPFAARLVLFLSTIPISIVMNSFRIMMVAVLVNHSGIEAAEGFMHYFEGWVIFFSCIVILLFEVIVMNKVMGKKVTLKSSFDYLESPSSNKAVNHQAISINKTPIIVSSALILFVIVSNLFAVQHKEIIPSREKFVNYPLSIDGWVGHPYDFRNGEEKILKLKDYFLANYTKADKSIGVYFGYTDSQKAGFVPHSPKACIPGGGWNISETTLKKIKINSHKTIKVTRLLISKGEEKLLVYYWFHQRGRDLSNEFSMKIALVYDAIKRNRTDGALVRFLTPVTDSEAEADKRLVDFVKLNYPIMRKFIPD